MGKLKNLVLIMPVGAKAPWAVFSKELDKERLSTPGAEDFIKPLMNNARGTCLLSLQEQYPYLWLPEKRYPEQLLQIHHRNSHPDHRTSAVFAVWGRRPPTHVHGFCRIPRFFIARLYRKAQVISFTRNQVQVEPFSLAVVGIK